MGPMNRQLISATVQRRYLTFKGPQLNRPTANTARLYRKLLIRDDGHNNGSNYNYAPMQGSVRSQKANLHL